MTRGGWRKARRPAAAKRLRGQAAEVPSQYSASSQPPSCAARHKEPLCEDWREEEEVAEAEVEVVVEEKEKEKEEEEKEEEDEEEKEEEESELWLELPSLAARIQVGTLAP